MATKLSVNVLRFIRKRWFLLSLLIFFFLIIESSPLVVPAPTSSITPAEVKQAKELAKRIIKPLASSQQTVEIELDRAGLNALAKLGNYTLEDLHASIGFNRFGAIAAVTYQPASWFNINARCEFAGGNDGIHRCVLGDLPIPGFIVEGFFHLSAMLVFDSEVASTLSQALEDLRFSDTTILLSVTKNKDFKESVRNSISDVASVVKTARGRQQANQESIEFYLEFINTLPENNELKFYIHRLMQQAQARSFDNDPIDENTAVIWAMAMSFASTSFADLIDYPKKSIVSRRVNLRGRQDHSLHFLYSAILEQVGSSNIGFKIGEIKEISDTNRGGSGYSFTDISADMSGIAFSRQLTIDEQSALDAQSLLANKEDDFLYFPPSHDLPEGLTESRFISFIGGVDSQDYSALMSKIQQRIAQTRLYNSKAQKPLISSIARHASTAQNKESGSWLTIDTHIHTKYSDGSFSIADIAAKATEFGCDVIAFTDHGDKNLASLFSEQYFKDIIEAERANPQLTIIRGMEWNVPPFNGREHATVLYPEMQQYNGVLQEFRSRFDHYYNWQNDTNNVGKALKWLESNAVVGAVKPVIIYNHPSRKDFLALENAHDFAYWSSYSDLVIGFSGAPGHQKRRGSDNGAYSTLLKTVHGWDPVVAEVGGAYDKLLQQGHHVFAARAASDFHETRHDYWPCEFSTTHTFASSSNINSVLESLQSGKTWAQHGKFIDTLDFTLESESLGRVEMGSVAQVKQAQTVNVNLKITLNQTDWQGFASSLDEVGIVVITPDSVYVEKPFPQQFMSGDTFNFTLPIDMQHSRLVVRAFARSIQPEQHHYMMYTNPIFVEVKK